MIRVSKKAKLVLVSFFLITMAVCTIFFLFSLETKSNFAYAYEINRDGAINEEYFLGSQFTVPTETVVVDGNEEVSTFVLRYPSGKATAEKNVTLDETGKYVIYYSCLASGKQIAFEESFTVKQKLTTHGAKTSAEYGAVKGLPNTNGLLVRLAKGDTIVLNEIIDVSDATLDDVLISSFVTSDEPGTAEFTRLIYTFTDVSDPENYFSISSRSSIDGIASNCTWVQACANGQPYAGYYSTTDTIFVGGTWGTQIGHSFFSYYYDATTKEENVGFYGEKKLEFRYDNSSREIYVIDNLRADSGLYLLNRKIADFDSSEFYTKLWRGLKTNKVRLSITAEGLVGETANFVITELMGVDLSTVSVINTPKPIISVHADEIPKAKTGASYIVPNASAVDYALNPCDISVSVWYNYVSQDNAVMIDVVDGVFETKYSGLYTIVYTVTDGLGNSATQNVWLETDDTIKVPEMILPQDKITETVRGQEVVFDMPQIFYGSGEKNVSISLKKNGEEEFFVNDTYRFMESGEYTVTYYITDYIGQKIQKSYTINVKNGTEPIFIEKPIFDDYFVSESYYKLPQIYASDFSSGTERKILATIEVTDKNGTRIINEGEDYLPCVENNLDLVTIKYIALNSQLVYNIPTVLSWSTQQGSSRSRMQLQNYFICNNVTATKSDAGMTISSNKEDGSWRFANCLVAEKFNFVYKSVIGKATFDALQVTLIDSVDKNVSLTITIAKKGSKSQISYKNDSKEIDEGFTTSSSNRTFDFSYKNNTITIGKGVLEVEYDDRGAIFNGFPSQKLILSVKFVNASIGSQYLVASINGQTTNDTPSDRIAPKIVLLSDQTKVSTINTFHTFPIAIAGDVLDPNVTFYFVVKTPSGKYAKSTDQTILNNIKPDKEYTLLLDEYGGYNIEYHAKDNFGGPEQITYSMITVEDCVAPTISFQSAFKSNIKIGEVIVLPKFTATDNVSLAENIIIRKYVYTPNGSLITIPENSNSFKCAYEGKYEFRFVAMDEKGNVGISRINVNVTT